MENVLLFLILIIIIKFSLEQFSLNNQKIDIQTSINSLSNNKTDIISDAISSYITSYSISDTIPNKLLDITHDTISDTILDNKINYIEKDKLKEKKELVLSESANSDKINNSLFIAIIIGLILSLILLVIIIIITTNIKRKKNVVNNYSYKSEKNNQGNLSKIKSKIEYLFKNELYIKIYNKNINKHVLNVIM